MFFLSKLLPLFLYPLTSSIIFQLIGLFLIKKRLFKYGFTLVFLSISYLYIFSTPFISRQLIWKLENKATNLQTTDNPEGDLAVVLGGGILSELPPRLSPEVNEAGDRLLKAISLIKSNRVEKIYLSGGNVGMGKDDFSLSESYYSKKLAVKLGVDPKEIIIDGKSLNTFQESKNLINFAKKNNYQTILLITSAFHMPRAYSLFMKISKGTNIKIIPVSCDYFLQSRKFFGKPNIKTLLIDFLPDAYHLNLSTKVFKEYLGITFYKLKGYV